MSLVGIVGVSTASLVLLQRASAASLCMDIPATGEGVNVQVWGCNGLPQQQWDASYIPLSLLNSPSLCLDESIDTTNGNLVTTGPCFDVDKNPAWHLVPDSGEIQFGSSGKCLDAGDMQEGTQLMIWECNGLSQQKWGFDSQMKSIYLADSRRLQSEEEKNVTMEEDRLQFGSSSTHASIGENSTRPRLRGASALAANTAQCVSLSGECGGPGRQTLSCCQGSCKPEVEGGVMKCVAATCAASNAECGGPGHQTLPCCTPGFSCSKISGTAVTKCMPSAPQCVPVSGDCGGPGRRTLSCCQGTCKPEMGGGVMKCVAATCAASYAECGGPGRQTLPCCTPGFNCRKTEEVSWDTVRKCMPF